MTNNPCALFRGTAHPTAAHLYPPRRGIVGNIIQMVGNRSPNIVARVIFQSFQKGDHRDRFD